MPLNYYQTPPSERSFLNYLQTQKSSMEATSTPNISSGKYPLSHPSMLMAFLYGYLRVDDSLIPIIRNEKSTSSASDGTERSDSSGYISSCALSSREEITKCNEKIHPTYVHIKDFSLGTFTHTSVIATEPLPEGVLLGTYSGVKILPGDDNSQSKRNLQNNAYIWEAFCNGKLVYTMDGSRDANNWLKHIGAARNLAEQNVEILYDPEKGGDLIFQTSRNIDKGCELLAWYQWSKWLDLIVIPDITTTAVSTSISTTGGGDTETTFPLENGVLSTSTANEEHYTSVSINSRCDRNKNISDCGGGDPREYTCDKCGSVFNYQYYLERHKKYTSCIDKGGRLYECKVCMRAFQKAERLRVHVKQVHEKVKPYKCHVCHKEFSQSSSLTKHLRIHTGARPYKCLECGKEFTASSILTTHMRQHTGEKPFKCKICKRGFASHAAHHSHARRSHGLEPKEIRHMSVDETIPHHIPPVFK